MNKHAITGRMAGDTGTVTFCECGHAFFARYEGGKDNMVTRATAQADAERKWEAHAEQADGERMRVYKPEAGDRLHLDRNCDDITNGHLAANANGYERHPAAEVEFDPFGEFTTIPLCRTCLRNHALSEERDMREFGPRFLLEDTESRVSDLHAGQRTATLHNER